MLVLYKKLSKQQKKFTEHKDCYFVLSVVHFGSMFTGSLEISVFWGTYNQVISFSMSCRIAGDIGFWWDVGSNWVNVFVSFIYILYTVSVKML